MLDKIIYVDKVIKEYGIKENLTEDIKRKVVGMHKDVEKDVRKVCVESVEKDDYEKAMRELQVLIKVGYMVEGYQKEFKIDN